MICISEYFDDEGEYNINAPMELQCPRGMPEEGGKHYKIRPSSPP